MSMSKTNHEICCALTKFWEVKTLDTLLIVENACLITCYYLHKASMVVFAQLKKVLADAFSGKPLVTGEQI